MGIVRVIDGDSSVKLSISYQGPSQGLEVDIMIYYNEDTIPVFTKFIIKLKHRNKNISMIKVSHFAWTFHRNMDIHAYYLVSIIVKRASPVFLCNLA